MKILFFSTYFYPYISGITAYPFKILTQLAKDNQITVLTFVHEKKLPAVETVEGLKIIRLPYLFKLSKGFISPQSLSTFYQEAKKTDLIILNIPNFEGLPLTIIGKLFGKKIISIFHCQVFLQGNLLSKFINIFLNASVFIQLTLSKKIIAYTKDYFNSLFIGKILKDKTVYVLPPIKKHPIENSYLKKLREKKGKKIWLGFCGRTAQEKGIEYLIEAVCDIVISAQIIFAGPYGKNVSGENNYYHKILCLLKQKNIDYLFLGNLSGGKLGAFYKAIDILVLPSINQTEAFGMVQAEAMLLGTPVITTNLPGVKIPIQLTKMGIVVEPKNSRQLTKAIIAISKDKINYTNDSLVKQASVIFDIKKTYDFYQKIFKE